MHMQRKGKELNERARERERRRDRTSIRKALCRRIAKYAWLCVPLLSNFAQACFAFPFAFCCWHGQGASQQRQRVLGSQRHGREVPEVSRQSWLANPIEQGGCYKVLAPRLFLQLLGELLLPLATYWTLAVFMSSVALM